MAEETQPLGAQLVETLVNAPAYLVGFVFGFIIAAFTDATVSTLVALAVLVGFLVNPLVAGIVFLGTYALARIVSNLANAIGFGLRQHGHHLGNVYEYQQATNRSWNE